MNFSENCSEQQGSECRESFETVYNLPINSVVNLFQKQKNKNEKKTQNSS